MKSFTQLRAAVLAACVIFLISYKSTFAQDGVRIAATTGIADPSAMLDVISSSKGLLVPRVNLAGLTNSTSPVNNPATGLLVYNLGGGGVPAVGFYYWTGLAWVQLTAGGFSGAGTVNYVTKWTASNALGTGSIYDNGNVGIGTTSPGYKLDVQGGSLNVGTLYGTNVMYGTLGSFDTRSTNPNPETYNMGVTTEFKQGSVIGVSDGGTYNTVLTIRNWSSGGDWTGGGVHQMAFTPSGNVYLRYSQTSGSWGTWRKVETAGSIPGETTANPLTSTTQADALNLRSGYYYFNFPGSTSGTVELFYQRNMNSGVGFVRVFYSPYNGVAALNYVGFNFPWTKFLVQTADGSTRATAFFSSTRLFNADGSTTTATGGDHAGYRVFLGSGGGMGIYNTGQNPCNWPTAAGAVGAGFNGSTCGSFPNGLLWGVGQGGTATYIAIGGVWEVWIAQ